MKIRSLHVLASVLSVCGSFVRADVELHIKPGAPDAPWAPAFAGGELIASTLPSEPANAVSENIKPGDYFAQSFVGNGNVLRGVALYGNGTHLAVLEYTLTIQDYGPVGVITTHEMFNPAKPAPIAVYATFPIKNSQPSKLYFEFTGDDCIPLKRGHGYVVIVAPSAEGNARFYRLTEGDSLYAEGTAARGPLQLNPHAFSAQGTLRDALFALYSSQPVKEP